MAHEWTWCGVTKCGCIRWACVDDPDYADSIGEGITNAIRHGLTIEKRETHRLQTESWRCPEHPAQARLPLTPAAPASKDGA